MGRRRLGSLLATVGLAGSLLLAVPPAALATNAYYGFCKDGIVPSSNYQRFFYKDSSSNYDGVYAQSTWRALNPCDPTGEGTHTRWGQAYVLITEQHYGDGHDNKMVQLGYGKCSAQSGWVCAFGDANARHFVYTANDNSGGVLADADSWSGVGQPVSGHTYGFYIKRLTSTWRYCITDLGPPTGTSYCHDTAASFSNGEDVWYGGETHNSRDEMGVNGGGLGFAVSDMEVHYVSSGVWSIGATGSGTCNGSIGSASYYHCLWGPSDTIDPYTDAHLPGGG